MVVEQSESALLQRWEEKSYSVERVSRGGQRIVRISSGTKNGTKPSLELSIIIAHRPGEMPRILQDPTTLQQLNCRAEMILVSGFLPAMQRNAGASLAQGEALYFLDDDSEMNAAAARAAMLTILSGDVEVIGGPAEFVAGPTPFAFHLTRVLSSRAAIGSCAARYRAIGASRSTNGENLIMCNLMLRRRTWKRINGLVSHIYPGEEQELFTRLNEANIRMVYDPHFIVRRPPPASLLQLIDKIFAYGYSRGAHVFKIRALISGNVISEIKFFLPAAMLIGCFVSLHMVLLAVAVASVCLFSLASTRSRSGVLVLPIAAALTVLIQVTYGAGSIAGLGVRIFRSMLRVYEAKIVAS